MTFVGFEFYFNVIFTPSHGKVLVPKQQLNFITFLLAWFLLLLKKQSSGH